MILSGADNRPPMLDKDLYDSWKFRIELYMQNREQERMILESVKHGPLIWPTIKENGVTRTKKYAELSTAEKTQADCDMKATNIILQVNTKFLNSLPLEWSKFVTDVKLVKDLHTTNFDQLHAYLKQHKLHANEVRLMRERNQDPLALFPPSQYGSIHPIQHYSSTYLSQPQFNHSSIPPSYPYQSQMNHQTSSVLKIAYQSPQVSTQPMTESPLVDSGLVVLVFSSGDDPIACLNKAMAFLTAVASLRFPSTNNQLRTSSNPRNQATIQDGRVTVQQVQGRQGQSYSGTGYKSNATSSGGNNASRQARVVKCYNCQGEGHMARQCTQPKLPRNAAWYKDKAMLAEAQEAGQILDEEQLAFLTDPGTEDLDTYDSDCNDISNAKAVLMANISNYGSDVISEIPHSETYLNVMENQSVHAMHDLEQTPVVDVTDNEITNSIILLGQKNTLAEYMILSDADNRPPMLDKDLYDSWKSIMELYMQNREYGRMMLESVEHGPLIWPTIEENRVTRTKKYAKLFAGEKIQADCDMKASQ
ncbi:integrase, catalytic region, zinc finger, CCHC-type containing protein [Tanacetum coccineum]|uniref:Integrase, catalytic region, zinc finger, CCHC-type containing protein n=1 Tax=Tanacetum coccineum TaxID=301880 RepID=A0ABQ5IM13_9ASTR